MSFKTHILWGLLIILVLIRYITTRPLYEDGDKVRVKGSVYSDPVKYSRSQFFRMGGMRIYLPLFPQIYYGDKIVVEGIIKEGVLKDAILVDRKDGVGVTKLRNKIIVFYSETIPEPYAGLLSGIVLGSKGSLSGDFYERTKKVGLTHVVVASGTNITFLVSFFLGIFTLFMTRPKAMLFVILSMILYLFLVGFEAPLVRAAIMAGVLFVSQGVGRVTSSWRIFFLTALVMLIIKPDWLVDVGFILSFAATASLILFENKIALKFSYLPVIAKESLSVSLAAQILVLPILFVVFGYISLWSPITNVLVLWTIPLIMSLGFMGAFLCIVIPILGKAVIFISLPLLMWFVRVVELFS